MAKPTDHVSDARQYAISAWNSASEERVDRRWIEQANISAQLAIATALERGNDIADRANELKRIEILVALSRVECENVSTPTDALDALYSRHGNGISEPKVLRTRPSIAASLGLGGESDDR